jgi:hypothetical protein
MTGKIESETFTRTLTGFDEVAIRKMFGASFDVLEGTLNPRALLFVQLRRDGAKDPDAFRSAMEIMLGDLEQLFQNPNEAGEVDEGKAPTINSPESSPTS